MLNTWRTLAVLALAAAACAAPAQTPAAAAPVSAASTAAAGNDGAALFQLHCAACHGVQRTGGMGPALLPESLSRLRRPEAAKVIASGRVATQMLPFRDRLNDAQVQALVQHIYTPVLPAPSWTDADIPARADELAALTVRIWPPVQA